MNITTSQKIWSHHNLLSVVHQANELIEREAGSKSETLAIYWGMVPVGETSGFALHLTVINAGSPQTPFTHVDVTDLQKLRQAFRQWCEG